MRVPRIVSLNRPRVEEEANLDRKGAGTTVEGSAESVLHRSIVSKVHGVSEKKKCTFAEESTTGKRPTGRTRGGEEKGRSPSKSREKRFEDDHQRIKSEDHSSQSCWDPCQLVKWKELQNWPGLRGAMTGWA